MRSIATVCGALCVVAVLALSGCSSQPAALSPAQDAQSAVASSSLAWTQYRSGRTLAATSITTLEDMLAAIADSESTLAELPANETTDAARALDAVRESADAVGSALAAVRSGDTDSSIGNDLSAARDELATAIEDLS